MQAGRLQLVLNVFDTIQEEWHHVTVDGDDGLDFLYLSVAQTVGYQAHALELLADNKVLPNSAEYIVSESTLSSESELLLRSAETVRELTDLKCREYTPAEQFIFAAETGDLGHIQKLFRHGLAPSIGSLDANNAVQAATKHNRQPVISLLTQAGYTTVAES
ncbi:hypothetical protein DIPPA_19231 [Diplonema papillatum]|nr:hypothetical protein DIPPA_19231 [Diplonema papillatum]